MTVFRGLIGCVLMLTAATSLADDKSAKPDAASPVRVDVRIFPEPGNERLTVQVHIENLTERELYIAHPHGDVTWTISAKDFTELQTGGAWGFRTNKRDVVRLAARSRHEAVLGKAPVVDVASSMILSWSTDKVSSNEQYDCEVKGFIILMPDGETTDISKGKGTRIDIRTQFGGSEFSTEAKSK